MFHVEHFVFYKCNFDILKMFSTVHGFVISDKQFSEN